MTKEEIDKIKQLQDLIKAHGLEDVPMVKAIMNFEYKPNTIVLEYFQQFVGKRLVRFYCKPVSLLYGHQYDIVMHKILNVDTSKDDENVVIVTLEVTTIHYYHNSITTTCYKQTYPYQECSYTTTYDDWQEVSEEMYEDFVKNINEFNKVGLHYVQQLVKELKGTKSTQENV